MRREGKETEFESDGERMGGVGRMPSGEEERKVADAGVGRIPAEEREGAETGTGEDTRVETEDESDEGSGRDLEEIAGLKEWTCR